MGLSAATIAPTLLPVGLEAALEDSRQGARTREVWQAQGQEPTTPRAGRLSNQVKN